MASFGGFAEIENAIKNAVKEGLEQAGEKGKEVAKQHVDSDVYGSHSPKEYSRTHTLKNTIVSEMVGDMEVEIKHDGMGGYSSVVAGYSANSSLMPELIHNSGGHPLWGGGTWSSGRPYMSNAEAEVEQVANEMIRQALASKGFDVG